MFFVMSTVTDADMKTWCKCLAVFLVIYRSALWEYYHVLHKPFSSRMLITITNCYLRSEIRCELMSVTDGQHRLATAERCAIDVIAGQHTRYKWVVKESDLADLQSDQDSLFIFHSLTSNSYFRAHSHTWWRPTSSVKLPFLLDRFNFCGLSDDVVQQCERLHWNADVLLLWC